MAERVDDTVDVQLAFETLERLLRSGAIRACELRCLNSHSKQQVHRFLLDSLCQRVSIPRRTRSAQHRHSECTNCSGRVLCYEQPVRGKVAVGSPLPLDATPAALQKNKG